MKKWQTEINLLTNLRELYQTTEVTNEKVYITVLNGIFRDITNNKSVMYVSKAAKKLADELGFDLRNVNWNQKDKLKVKKGEKLFHYEHCIPIKQLDDLLLTTNQKIKSIIDKDFVCWITEEEHKALDSNAQDKKYRKNWKEIFAKYGIEPILNK